MINDITVLRLDHREIRDQRITTHVALTSRAFGAIKFYYTGDSDGNMEESITDVANRWGGNFSVEHITSPSSLINNWEGIIIHLTMYGEKHFETIETLNQNSISEPILLIVGGSKVPRYIYYKSDFNTAIGWQPHSEVTAVGVFLHQLVGNDELYKKYSDAEIVIKEDNVKSMRSERFSD